MLTKRQNLPEDIMDFKKTTLILIAALLTTAKICKQLKCPSKAESIKRVWTHTHTLKYYSAIKKNESLQTAATWMTWRALCLVKQDRQRKANTA